MADRAAIHAYLSQDAHAGLQNFAVEEGVSMSALLEGFGNHLAATPAKPLAPSVLVKSARVIDGERRQRGSRD